MLRSIKYRLRALAIPALLLALTYYFSWNAVHGKSGLQSQAAERVAMTQALAKQAEVHDELIAWQTRIAGLQDRSIQPDMLDQQARQVLNLAEPDDLVIDLSSPKLPPGQPSS